MKLLVLAEVRSRRRMLVGVALGTFAFVWLMAGTYEAFGGAAAFNSFLATSEQPSLFSAFTGSRGVAFLAGPVEYLAFGFNHPLFLLLTMSVGVAIGANAVAGDVENGRAELIYTRAVPRTRIYDARVGLWAVAQVLIVVMGLFGAWVGALSSTDLRQAELGSLVWVVLQYLPLAAFAAAAAFAASAVRSTRGSAIGLTVGVLAGSYLANFTALLWEPAAFLEHVNPFGYYSPIDSVGGVNWVDAAVLSVLALALLGGGRWWLTRRDLV